MNAKFVSINFTFLFIFTLSTSVFSDVIGRELLYLGFDPALGNFHYRLPSGKVVVSKEEIRQSQPVPNLKDGGSIYVTVSDSKIAADVIIYADGFGMQPLRIVHGESKNEEATVVFSVPSEKRVNDLSSNITALTEIPGVKAVGYPVNFKSFALQLPPIPTRNDQYFWAQWSLNNTGQTYRTFPFTLTGTPGADLSVPEAWRAVDLNQHIVVAVLDTGVRHTHDDLEDVMWTDPSPNLWSRVVGSGNLLSGDHGLDLYDGDDDPDEGDLTSGHGTPIAGIIAAEANNNIGVSGIAPNALIMAVKSGEWLGTGGTYNHDAVVDGIYFAVDHGARIINFSLGLPGSAPQWQKDEVEDAITYAEDNGVLVVVAAGNETGSPGEDMNNDTNGQVPQSLDNSNLIVVAATSDDDVLTSFSYTGPSTVHVGAPGEGIASTLTFADNGYSTPTGAHYSRGTSFSAPMVSGSLALLMGQFTSDSYLESKIRLMMNGDAIPSLSSTTVTGKRVNIWRSASVFSLEDRFNFLGYTRDSDWFGWMDDEDYPLIYHSQLGVLLFDPSSSRSTTNMTCQFEIFEGISGGTWVHVSENDFPWMYRWGDSSWISFISSDPSAIVFWNQSTQSYEYYPPLGS